MSTPIHPAIARLRSVALVGPTAGGKTQLAEALLAATGAIGTAGSVDRGATVSDFDPLERKARHSLQASVMHLDRGEVRIHLLDTPGGPDYVGHALSALEAVDTAAVVLDAQAGLGSGADRLMAWAERRPLDRMIIVNKIDVVEGKLQGLVEQIQAAFGRECLPLNLPADGGTKVVDCFFANTEPAGARCDFSSVAAAHRALVEQVVEVDGEFVDRYLNDGDVDPRELHAPLEQALREGHLIPICFVSARTGAGVRELLDVFDRLLPNPAEGNPPQFFKGEGEAAVPLAAQCDPAQHVIAHVFKVTNDPYIGKMGIFRIHQGTVTKDSVLYVGDGRKPFKVGHLYVLQGKDHVEVDKGVPGDICAVAKVDELHFDAVLHDAAEDDHLHLKPADFPVPVHGLAIAPARRGDEQRLWQLLHKLVDEDPCLRLEHVATTNETVVYGLGELHLRTLVERLTEVHKCDVQTRPPRIAYRETITAPAEGHHRHKKQTGGAGQFGEVFLKVEPLARGAGFEFVDQVKGGAIPGQFMPAVEKGVRLAMEAGVVAGYPLQDLRVVVTDGKSHSVDSKEIAFVTAGKKAFIAAVREARPIVLEPIVRVEVAAPTSATGDITGDLASRRGHVEGTQNAGDGHVVVQGVVPLAELTAYQARLNGMTSGEGRYTLALSHYEPVPPTVQQQLAAKYAIKDED